MKTILMPAFVFLLITAMVACKQKHKKNIREEIISSNLNLVDDSDAVQYVKNYSPRAGSVLVRRDITDSIPYIAPNTRCIWFSTEQLSNLIHAVEDEGGDGIRIYIAAYDSTYDIPAGDNPSPPVFSWNRNTMLLVSTKDSVASDKGTYHRDYYDNKGDKTRKNGFIVTAKAQNRGEMCPPPANCYDVGALLIRN
jgi:hypothetical protein